MSANTILLLCNGVPGADLAWATYSSRYCIAASKISNPWSSLFTKGTLEWKKSSKPALNSRNFMVSSNWSLDVSGRCSWYSYKYNNKTYKVNKRIHWKKCMIYGNNHLKKNFPKENCIFTLHNWWNQWAANKQEEKYHCFCLFNLWGKDVSFHKLSKIWLHILEAGSLPHVNHITNNTYFDLLISHPKSLNDNM